MHRFKFETHSVLTKTAAPYNLRYLSVYRAWFVDPRDVDRKWNDCHLIREPRHESVKILFFIQRLKSTFSL